MPMSKKIEKSTIQTSVFDTERENNDPKIEALLKQALPELSILFDKFGLTMNELLEFSYSLKLVRRHGWGNVEAVVQDHQVTSINAVVKRKLGNIENATLPKRENVV